MIVVTVNSGSTSIKLAAFEVPPLGTGEASALRSLASIHHEGTQLDALSELREFLGALDAPPAAVAHRVVHGGTRFTHPVLIDEGVRRAIADLSELAPLHNPLSLRWIDAARRVCGPEVAQVATFDTAFFAALPPVASQYALPPELGADTGVRRYGFHGLAHEAMWQRWCELTPGLEQGGRLITVQLGGGCSVAALESGRPRDVSMGFSPLEGLVMATRSGDIDAAIVPYLSARLDISAAQVIEALNREAGLKGLTGGETNPGKLLAEGSEQGRFAVDLYCYRVRKYIGAYLAVLGGCDGIVFGGGVGEHVPQVRSRILSGMQWAGITIDATANQAASGIEARIGAADGAVGIWTVRVAEEPLLARAAVNLLRRVQGDGARLARTP